MSPRSSVQVGQRVAAGAPLMAVVPLDDVWVEANFKESQLADVRVGQPATVVADLYGGGVEYHGRVSGFGAGTGAAFALLPAQNATGNWIKVVQRVPVRVALDPKELAGAPAAGRAVAARGHRHARPQRAAPDARQGGPRDAGDRGVRRPGAQAAETVQRIIRENAGKPRG